MRLSDVAQTYAAKLRAQYKAMPAEMSPRTKCDCIAHAEGNGLDAERVRFMISFGMQHLICAVCWKEFSRIRTAGYRRPHKCEECYHTYVLEAAKQCRRRGWVPKSKQTPTVRKFMRPDELRRFALRELNMSESEFGEALADVQVYPTYPRVHA